MIVGDLFADGELFIAVFDRVAIFGTIVRDVRDLDR